MKQRRLRAVASRRYTVDAAAKALDLLNAFSFRDRRLPLAELSTRTRIPRATAFRFLLRPSTYHAEYQPDLFRWLDQFPAASTQDGDSFLYWSRER